MPRFLHFALASALVLPVCHDRLGAAQAGDAPETKTASTITGKERLGPKWSDEQRVDDCHVPEEYRTQERPDSCSNWTEASAKPNETEAAAEPEPVK